MIRLRGRCMHYFKKTLLAAAMAAFSLTVAFPAFADEPVGMDVTSEAVYLCRQYLPAAQRHPRRGQRFDLLLFAVRLSVDFGGQYYGRQFLKRI